MHTTFSPFSFFFFLPFLLFPHLLPFNFRAGASEVHLLFISFHLFHPHLTLPFFPFALPIFSSFLARFFFSPSAPFFCTRAFTYLPPLYCLLYCKRKAIKYVSCTSTAINITAPSHPLLLPLASPSLLPLLPSSSPLPPPSPLAHTRFSTSIQDVSAGHTESPTQ